MSEQRDLSELFKALAEVRKKLEQPAKNKQGYGYKYADLADVENVINKAVEGTGVDYHQNVTNNPQNGQPQVTTIITHTSGQY